MNRETVNRETVNREEMGSETVNREESPRDYARGLSKHRPSDGYRMRAESSRYLSPRLKGWGVNLPFF